MIHIEEGKAMTIKDIFEMLDLFYAIKHMHEKLLRAEKRKRYIDVDKLYESMERGNKK